MSEQEKETKESLATRKDLSLFQWLEQFFGKESEEKLVTREDFQELIDGVEELKPYREYMKKRWIGMIMWWHTRSVKARWEYFFLRLIIVVGGVLIPVLTTLSMRSGWQEFTNGAIAVVGAIVAGCAAWEGVANYGDIWREKRRAAELLKVEGWRFIALSDKYQTDKEYKVAFPHFVAEVENMIAKEVGEYLAAFDPSIAQAQKAAADITNTILEETKKRISQQQTPQVRTTGERVAEEKAKKRK